MMTVIKVRFKPLSPLKPNTLNKTNLRIYIHNFVELSHCFENG
ncbi:hypothetical protein QFZ28_000236 [Neobacillus niacini]|nr:hypothetical protein [Neobacillus niacini]